MTPAPSSQRIALAVEYDGSAFSGWQKQRSPRHPSVQDALEAALGRVADHSVRVHCAGRTDAGVHATAQVVHFDTPRERPLRAWTLGVNSHLPDSVAVLRAQAVPAEFHARHSARSRTYRYCILNRAQRPGVGHGGLTWVRAPLDAARMHAAAQCLPGERDFSAFRAAGCQSSTPMRCVTAVQVWRQGDLVVLEVTANAFLLHMVRNLAGSLIAVGKGDWTAEAFAAVLAGRDRARAAATAPPDGLYLVEVTYPAEYALPVLPRGPVWLSDERTLTDSAP